MTRPTNKLKVTVINVENLCDKTNENEKKNKKKTQKLNTKNTQTVN